MVHDTVSPTAKRSLILATSLSLYSSGARSEPEASLPSTDISSSSQLQVDSLSSLSSRTLTASIMSVSPAILCALRQCTRRQGDRLLSGLGARGVHHKSTELCVWCPARSWWTPELSRASEDFKHSTDQLRGYRTDPNPPGPTTYASSRASASARPNAAQKL